MDGEEKPFVQMTPEKKPNVDELDAKLSKPHSTTSTASYESNHHHKNLSASVKMKKEKK